MEQHVTVIPNTHPAYVAEPDFGEKGSDVKGVNLNPVIAWRIEYDVDQPADSSSTAIPITIDYGLPGYHAVYFSDSKRWSISDGESGSGLTALTEYFRENVVVDGA